MNGVNGVAFSGGFNVDCGLNCSEGVVEEDPFERGTDIKEVRSPEEGELVSVETGVPKLTLVVCSLNKASSSPVNTALTNCQDS